MPSWSVGWTRNEKGCAAAANGLVSISTATSTTQRHTVLMSLSNRSQGRKERLAIVSAMADRTPRSPVERRIIRSGVDENREGKPLSRRARQTRRTVEAYLAAGVMPRYMERLHEIEAERQQLRRRIARAYRSL